MSGGSDSKLNASYYRLMVYAAIIGALASLVTTGYITLVNLGIKFFAQPTLILSNINFWPLILLGTTGVFVGLLIKFFGSVEEWELLKANTSRPVASTTATCQAYFFKDL